MACALSGFVLWQPVRLYLFNERPYGEMGMAYILEHAIYLMAVFSTN